MRNKLITGAAASLLVGAALCTGLAQAQDRNRGGETRGSDTPRAAPDRTPAAEKNREPRVDRTQERRERPQRAEPQERQRTQRAEPKRETPKRVERPEQKREAQQKRDEQKRDTKQATPKADKADGKQARDRKGDDRQQVKGRQASTEQRVRLRERIFREPGVGRISRSEFGVSIGVGSHVDRRHRLHRLTPAILVLAPVYLGYSYIVVEDTICIVDPETYVIVDVIPSSLQYAEGPPRVQLALSAGDMHFIYASVPREQTADIRIHLALGAEVPERIDLERFPDSVIDRVPQIGDYRYIVVLADVVVVDPADRSVALVITE